MFSKQPNETRNEVFLVALYEIQKCSAAQIQPEINAINSLFLILDSFF
jgi:hypothetical protein